MIRSLRIKAHNPGQLAGTLSGGNQQKVIFGKMLLTEARVLLLYDPTRGVDVGTKGEIFQLMRDLAAARLCHPVLFERPAGARPCRRPRRGDAQRPHRRDARGRGDQRGGDPAGCHVRGGRLH